MLQDYSNIAYINGYCASACSDAGGNPTPFTIFVWVIIRGYQHAILREITCRLFELSTSSRTAQDQRHKLGNIVLRKLWSVNLNLVATNVANKLVSLLCHYFSTRAFASIRAQLTRMATFRGPYPRLEILQIVTNHASDSKNIIPKIGMILINRMKIFGEKFGVLRAPAFRRCARVRQRDAPATAALLEAR